MIILWYLFLFLFSLIPFLFHQVSPTFSNLLEPSIFFHQNIFPFYFLFLFSFSFNSPPQIPLLPSQVSPKYPSFQFLLQTSRSFQFILHHTNLHLTLHLTNFHTLPFHLTPHHGKLPLAKKNTSPPSILQISPSLLFICITFTNPKLYKYLPFSISFHSSLHHFTKAKKPPPTPLHLHHHKPPLQLFQPFTFIFLLLHLHGNHPNSTTSP